MVDVDKTFALADHRPRERQLGGSEHLRIGLIIFVLANGGADGGLKAYSCG